MLSCAKKEEEKQEPYAPPGYKLKLGVIGLGNRGLSHLRVIQRIPEIEVAAICDLNPGAFSSAKEYVNGNPVTYTDYKEMIAREELDAISVIVPNHLHHELSIYGMEHNLHVLCEKPMSINVDFCRQMIDAQERTGKILLIGTQLRYMPLFQKIKKAVHEDNVLGPMKFGNVLLFRGDWPRFLSRLILKRTGR